MLLCTLSQGQLLHPVHGFSLGYAQMSVLQISRARTKTSSLSETGDLQGSIWQPGCRASRLDDLEMKNANNASFLQVSWQEWTNSIHSFLNVSLPLPLLLCHSPSPCHSVFPSLSFVLHPHRWLVRGRGGLTETGYTVCQPAADVPGGAPLSAEVSNKESLGPGTGGQAVSLSALRVTLPPPPLSVISLPVLSLAA